jgi:predicted Zn-dependent peptidase
VGARVDRAAALADLAGAGLDPKALPDLHRALESVDAEDVRRVCRTYLSPDRVALVVTGDRKSLEEPLRDVGEVEVRPETLGATASGPTAALR